MSDDTAPPRKFKGRQQARNCGPDGKHIPSQQAGRRGGRPRTRPREVAPIEAAIPASVPFPVSESRWELFCQNFANNGGKIKPACDRVGLLEGTVREWFTWATAGKEPWRTEVSKAMALLSDIAGKVGQHAARKDPWTWLHTAYPEVYAHPRVALDVTSGGATVDDLIRKLIAIKGEGSGEDGGGSPRDP